jgi:hypothetical protein
MIQGMIRHTRGAFYEVFDSTYKTRLEKTYLSDVQALSFYVRRLIDEGSAGDYGNTVPIPLECRAGGVLWLSDPEQVVELACLTPRDQISVVDLVVLYAGTKGDRSVRFKRVIFAAGRTGSQFATLRPPVDKGQAVVQMVPFRVSNEVSELEYLPDPPYQQAAPISNYIIFGQET